MSSVDPGSAVLLSIEVAILCAVLGLPIALPLGWLLARRRFAGKAVVSTLVFVPLVLPPVVTGLLLLTLLGRGSWLGSALDAAGLPVPFTFGGATLAALVVGLPLYVMAIRTALESVDRRYEEIALTLGVPPRRTFWRVTLPLALPGILAGAALAFGRALGEFGATVVLAGNIEGRTRTLALAVYTLLEVPRGEEASAVLVWASLALALLSLLGYEALLRWQRRRLEVDR